MSEPGVVAETVVVAPPTVAVAPTVAYELLQELTASRSAVALAEVLRLAFATKLPAVELVHPFVPLDCDVSTNELDPTVMVTEPDEVVVEPLKVPSTFLTVGFGVKVKTFAPLVMVTLPELRTLAVNVPPFDAAVPPLAVKVVPATVTVVPSSLEPVNVPVRLALTAWKPVTFSAKTTKSCVQLGAWLMSKLYFAGNILAATCELLEGPSE